MKTLLTTTALCLCSLAGIAQISSELPQWIFGDYKVTLLSEGQSQGNKSILLNAPDDVVAKYIPNGTFPNATNAFLVQSNGKNVLVDAGYGKKLFENLEKINIKAENIDIILLTHLHGDHIGGMIKDGKATFPKAQVYMSKAEFDYWSKQDNKLAKDVLSKYKKQIHTFVPKEINEVHTAIIKEFPQLFAVAGYGHTPGHTMFLLQTEIPLLIWGDLTHAMAVQMPHPEIAVTYDVNPQLAVQSRLKVLEYVSKNHIFVAGMHIAYPSIGTIELAQKTPTGEFNGYKFMNKQEIMKEVCNFLKECGVYYLATLDDDNQPRVRPFGTATIFEDNLYIQTGKKKEVSKQMLKNPKVEICAYNILQGKWLRIEAEVVEDDRLEAKEFMLEQYPSLKGMYDAKDSNTQVLYLQNVKATYSSFSAMPTVVEW